MEQYFLTHGTPVESNDINKFIDLNHIQLPLEYVNFIKNINGGKTRFIAFELKKFDFNDENPNYYIDIFFSLNELTAVWKHTSVILNDYDLFPIADVRGGMIICCKQNRSFNAELFFFDNNSGIIPLTKSLDEFLSFLIPESAVDYKKYGFDV